MPYLQLNDYKTYIQGDYLRQLVQGDDDKRVVEENSTTQAIAQRLTQKYDLDAEFTDMRPYDKTKAYGAAERVTVDISTNGFTAWVASTAYSVHDLVIYNSIGYVCITNNTDATFIPNNWTAIAPQYTIFYAAYPECTVNGQVVKPSLTNPYAPVFNYKQLYVKDDVVFWKGNTYVCNQPSTVITHQAALQFTAIGNIPYANVFPDDPVNNSRGQYWKDRTEYVVIPNTPLTEDAWVRGDNRNQTIKDAMVRITVFKLSPLIAPKNRPDVWLDDHRSMMRELNDAADGNITLSLPLRQPQTGLKTHFGGFVKNNNNW